MSLSDEKEGKLADENTDLRLALAGAFKYSKFRKGDKVYVAPEDLTDDDGFRDEGIVVGLLTSKLIGDSDTYYDVLSTEDLDKPEFHAVREDCMTPRNWTLEKD